MSNAAAGVFFYSVSTNRFLYLLRSDNKSPTWSMPGGTIDTHETLLEGLTRECFEEMRVDITNFKLVPIQKFTNNSFVYHTFFCRVDDEFIPILNREHVGYAWVEQNNYPKPLHPGLFSTINIDLVIEKLQFLIN
jgi:8-oxo-dGTP pyrophosphatase MutT (NUDIX family)